MKIVKKVFKILNNKNLKIVFAESMTGGNLSYLLTKNKGASNVLLGSFVTYNNELKNSVLNVSKEVIKTFGVVSTNVTSQMAQNAQKLTYANVSVSVSGYASKINNTNKYLTFCYTIIFKNQLYDFKINYKPKSRVKNINYVSRKIYESIYNIII